MCADHARPMIDQLPPEVVHFAQMARSYCDFIEVAHRYLLTERVLRCAALVANLYAAGLYLPEIEEPTGLDSLPAAAELPDWPAFEELTLFWQVPDVHDWAAPEVFSLSDMLLGMYREIKPSLLAYDQGCDAGEIGPITVAVWRWQRQMDQTWGGQAVDALRALHQSLKKLSGE